MQQLIAARHSHSSILLPNQSNLYTPAGGSLCWPAGRQMPASPWQQYSTQPSPAPSRPALPLPSPPRPASDSSHQCCTDHNSSISQQHPTHLQVVVCVGGQAAKRQCLAHGRLDAAKVPDHGEGAATGHDPALCLPALSNPGELALAERLVAGAGAVLNSQERHWAGRGQGSERSRRRGCVLQVNLPLLNALLPMQALS